jgi:hypothetical protein
MSNLITQGLSASNQTLVLMGMGDNSSGTILSANISLLTPVVSANALVVVNVFEASTDVPSTSMPSTNEVDPLLINSQLNSPVISAGAMVSVIAFSATGSLQNEVDDTAIIEKQSVATSILQPKVTGEKQKQQTSGWPYDAGNTLGAGAGIPFGVISGTGKKSPYITIQYKICGDNFPCEEGIYQKESGLRNTIKIVIDKIRHKVKKSNVKIKGDIVKMKNYRSINVQFLKLEKVNV